MKTKRSEKNYRGIFDLVISGYSNDEIGRELNLKTPTVKWHITRIFKAEEVPSRMKLMAKYAKKAYEMQLADEAMVNELAKRYNHE